MMRILIAIMLCLASQAWARVYVFTTETVTTTETTTTTTQPPAGPGWPTNEWWYSNMVMRYTCDNAVWTNADGTIKDDSPYHNNPGIIGAGASAVTYSNNGAGGCVYMDGSPDYIMSTLTNSLNGATSFVVSVWYWYNAASWSGTKSHFNITGNAGKTTILQMLSNGNRAGSMATIGGLTTQGATVKTWHNLILSKSATNDAHLYIDGEESTNSPWAASTALSQTNAVIMGCDYALGNPFTGWYDDPMLLVNAYWGPVEATNYFEKASGTGGH